MLIRKQTCLNRFYNESHLVCYKISKKSGLLLEMLLLLLQLGFHIADSLRQIVESSLLSLLLLPLSSPSISTTKELVFAFLFVILRILT
jgi:hypothetical protein